jgi:hypothetical protein
VKAILFRLAAVFIGLAVVAFLTEVALQLFAPLSWFSVGPRNLFCRFDHELGWAPFENITRIADGWRAYRPITMFIRDAGPRDGAKAEFYLTLLVKIAPGTAAATAKKFASE